MKYLFLSALLFAFPAHAQMDFGGTDISKPRAMMVAGGSVVDDENSNNSRKKSTSTPRVEEVRDDANSMMDPKKTAPAMPDIDPFQPAPTVERPENVKRVLKRIPAAKIERSIADDRIDDGYVQQMMKKNLDFTGPIE